MEKNWIQIPADEDRIVEFGELLELLLLYFIASYLILRTRLIFIFQIVTKKVMVYRCKALIMRVKMVLL